MILPQKTASVDVGGKQVQGTLIELENAVLCFIWHGEKPRMGSTVVTLPDGTTSQVIGERDQLTSRLAGERLAKSYSKLALVSTNLPADIQFGREFSQLLADLTRKQDE